MKFEENKTIIAKSENSFKNEEKFLFLFFIDKEDNLYVKDGLNNLELKIPIEAMFDFIDILTLRLQNKFRILNEKTTN